MWNHGEGDAGASMTAFPRRSVTAIKLRKKAPSPAGEGWGEENKNKVKALFDPSHPNLLPEGEGTVRA